MSCNRFYHERRKPLFPHKSFFNLKQGVRKFKGEIYNHVYRFYMIRHTRAILYFMLNRSDENNNRTINAILKKQ